MHGPLCLFECVKSVLRTKILPTALYRYISIIILPGISVSFLYYSGVMLMACAKNVQEVSLSFSFRQGVEADGGFL